MAVLVEKVSASQKEYQFDILLLTDILLFNAFLTPGFSERPKITIYRSTYALRTSKHLGKTLKEAGVTNLMMIGNSKTKYRRLGLIRPRYRQSRLLYPALGSSALVYLCPLSTNVDTKSSFLTKDILAAPMKFILGVLLLGRAV